MENFRSRSFFEFLQILWRKRALIGFVTAVVLLAALIVILNLPKVYESRALVVVSGEFFDRQANSAQIAAVTEQITSRANLASLIERYALYPDTKNLDYATTELAKDIKIETKYRSDNDGLPESFTLSFRHPDAQTAKQVVSDVVAIFNAANSSLEKQASEELHFVRSEITQIESRIKGVGTQKALGAARATAASRAAGAYERSRTEREAALASMEELGNREFLLQRQIADKKREIVQQQEIVRSAAPPDDYRSSSSYSALLRRKAELEGKLKDYTAQYTESHPKIADTRAQLAEVNRQIAEAAAKGEPTRAAASSPEAVELRNLQRELSRLEIDLEVVQRETAKKRQAAGGALAGATAPPRSLPAVPFTSGGSHSANESGSGRVTEFEEDSLKERYSNLLKREEALRPFTPSPAGPGAPFFQTVDQPNLPLTPAAPNRRKLMGFALVMALGAGLVLAIAFEIPKLYRIQDDRDVAYYLGVPVLALIPETLTTTERQRSRRQWQARSLRLLLIGAAAVPVLAFVFYAVRLFEILGK